jgi:alkanesulfonate monooxygenase SsuD/methylene tetrahydromethanopterin reductase-like flavin-dependent oxidoreductase (luciferase family)
MKNIGFLSFGHWTPSPQSQVRSASDALLQSIELAVAAEELGADGAYFRVHHFARQLGSPFPLLAACGAKTKRIEIGTAVIDMRYENPLYMAEDAGAADLIAGGRLQLGISRGSPEQVIDGGRHFGYSPPMPEEADLRKGTRQARWSDSAADAMGLLNLGCAGRALQAIVAGARLLGLVNAMPITKG